MDSEFGRVVFFVGLLTVVVGPALTCYVRTKDSTVWFNPKKLLRNYGKAELLAHLLGILLLLTGVFLLYSAQ
jgi:hypothetical protein